MSRADQKIFLEKVYHADISHSEKNGNEHDKEKKYFQID